MLHVTWNIVVIYSLAKYCRKKDKSAELEAYIWSYIIHDIYKKDAGIRWDIPN